MAAVCGQSLISGVVSLVSAASPLDPNISNRFDPVGFTSGVGSAGPWVEYVPSWTRTCPPGGIVRPPGSGVTPGHWPPPPGFHCTAQPPTSAVALLRFSSSTNSRPNADPATGP